MSKLIRATNVAGFRQLVTELGGEPEPMLERFGIPVGVEDREDAFISNMALGRLLDAAASELDAPDFGLRLASWQGLHILGPVAVIARNSATVLDAFLGIGRYIHVHSPALRLSVAGPGDAGFDPNVVTLLFSIEEEAMAYLPQSFELSLANGMSIARLLTDEQFTPQLTAFQHSQIGPQDSYRKVFGSPVIFDAEWCGMSVSAETANHPVNNADPATRRLVAEYLDAEYRPDEEVAPRVAILVRRLLPTGTCSATQVAGHLGLHPRTFQRRLADEETTFGAIIDKERADQAAKLLANPGLQLTQIAGLLGYSEQSTFNRSFRRWFGTTPREFRKRQGE